MHYVYQLLVSHSQDRALFHTHTTHTCIAHSHLAKERQAVREGNKTKCTLFGAAL